MAAKAAARKRPRTLRTLDRGPLPGLLGFQIRQAQIAVFRDFVEAMGELDITPGLYAVLELIDRNEGLKQGELARAVQLDRSTVVSVIDTLEARELVRRCAVEHDRRAKALALTSTGVALLKTLRRRVAAHEKRLAARLATAEQEQLATLLGRIFPEHRSPGNV